MLLTRRGRREPNRQVLDAADQRDAHRVERHRVTDDLDVGQTCEQLPERHRDLPAGEVGTQAEVRSRPTETDVRVRVAQHVETFGVVELARVAVRDAVEQDDLVAFGELVVTDTRRPSVAVRRMNVTGDATRTISSTAVVVTPSRSSCHIRR